jgi:hypothetical protein
MVFMGVLSFPQVIDPLIVTGVSLWALTLYLSLARLRQRTMERLTGWLGTLGRRSSEPDAEKTRSDREAKREIWASLLSTVPFLIVGGLCYYGIVLELGQSWAISFGLMGAITSGIYELARASGASS